MGRPAHMLPGLVLAAFAAAPAMAAGDLRDLYFGEALYESAQGRYFEALERLDAELAQHRRVDEPERDSLHYHIGSAEFSVGDFELNYRMHHRAGRAIKAVLEANVDEAVRNEAAFRLARIHFQKDQPENALQALDRIHGKIPESIRVEVEFLRASVYLALGRPADAVPVLTRIQGAQGLKGFTAYNLGIALLQEGRSDAGLQQLDKAGQVESRGDATAAIRDKSNMVLGRLMLESSQFDRAQRSFDRVRLEGPYSNQALLNAGWADVSAGNFGRALVPWRILVDRDVTDSAVQEARLALPFAYGKLNLHGRAAVLYGQALDSFGQELGKVSDSIRSIREGKFLKALVREEIRQDRNWVVRLRSLPETPETYYLTTLMASHDFQTALQNYLDLEDLRRKLLSWQSSFDAFDDLIGLRRANYEPLLPGIDAQFRELDSQIRLRIEQRDNLQKRLQGILTAPRPELLATADERIALERIRLVEKALSGVPEAQRAELQQRVERLKGVLTWTLRTEYPERLTNAHKHLRELQQDVDVLTARYEAFVRTRQAAMHSYVGYDTPIARLRTRVAKSLQQVNMLMGRQGALIETVAIAELGSRAERIEKYQAQARYAVADSYDRATKVQTSGAGGQP
jgi:tetratricopeptide (TPR) repeat protein